MNLRPPGPQPERSRRTRCDSALEGGPSCSELGSVALKLDPELDPAGIDAAAVVGSRGRSAHCEILLGIAAMATLHHAHRPLLAVPPPLRLMDETPSADPAVPR